MSVELKTGNAFDFQALSGAFTAGLEFEQRRFINLSQSYGTTLSQGLQWFMLPDHPLCEVATQILQGYSYCSELAQNIHATAIGLTPELPSEHSDQLKFDGVMSAMDQYIHQTFSDKTAHSFWHPFESLAKSLNARLSRCFC